MKDQFFTVLFSIVKADFQERTRRSSFLVTLCLVLYLGYAVNSGQILIRLGDYRGIYNSAWVGSLMAIVISFFLGLIGFFLVKNTIERDERSGVGQILATTPITRIQYLLGKWLSNFAVLAALVGLLALAAVFMQLIYREAASIQLWTLLAPLLLIALPMMSLVAALAVFFETVRWLKGGFGNLVYFFLFLSFLVVGVFLPQAPWIDGIGITLVGSSMKVAAKMAFPAYDGSFVLAMIGGKPLATFVWPGLEWTVGLIAQRLAWIVVSVGITLAGALFFDRFDPNKKQAARSRPASQALDSEVMRPEMGQTENNAKTVVLTSFSSRGFRLNFFRLVWLELLLLIKGLKWYWFAGMGAIWIVSAAVPLANLRKVGFLLAVIWPVLVWSKMGERENRYQTGQLIYQAAYPLVRLLVPAWTAGVLFTAVVESGVLSGRAFYDAPLGLVQWILAILFIPTLGLTLGIWSRSSKPFEVIYPILWYLGPMNPQNGLAVLDYLGIHALALVNTSPLLAVGVIFLLIGLALIGRKRQMVI